MPKVTGGLAAAVLAVLVLTGCAGQPDVPTGTVGVGAEKVGPAATEPAPAPSEPAELTAEEQYFVDNEVWEPFGLTDAELLAAADFACDEFTAGKTGDDMAIPGIPEDLTRYFANGAREQFCAGAGF